MSQIFVHQHAVQRPMKTQSTHLFFLLFFLESLLPAFLSAEGLAGTQAGMSSQSRAVMHSRTFLSPNHPMGMLSCRPFRSCRSLSLQKTRYLLVFGL